MRRLALLFLCLMGPAWSEPLTSYTGFVKGREAGWAALRSREEYLDFVARIPTQRLQMKQPAPPSDDPLLKLPEFDFDRDALIVAWSHHVYIIARIEEVRRVGDDLEVDIRFNIPENLEARAAPSGIGHYHLLKVESFKGALKVTAHD